MNSARKGPMSRDRPQAAAECSEDRVRTVAKPAALDSGPCALCVGQEVASNAEATRTGRRHPHATPHRPRAACHRGRCEARASGSVRNRRTPRRAAWPVTAVHARPLGDPRRFPGRPALLRPSRASASRRRRRPRTAREPGTGTGTGTGTGKMPRPAQRPRPSKAGVVRPSSPLAEIRVDSCLGLRTGYAQGGTDAQQRTERTEKGRDRKKVAGHAGGEALRPGCVLPCAPPTRRRSDASRPGNAVQCDRQARHAAQVGQTTKAHEPRLPETELEIAQIEDDIPSSESISLTSQAASRQARTT